jgi:hypothetical protein
MAWRSGEVHPFVPTGSGFDAASLHDYIALCRGKPPSMVTSSTRSMLNGLVSMKYNFLNIKH